MLQQLISLVPHMSHTHEPMSCVPLRIAFCATYLLCLLAEHHAEFTSVNYEETRL